MYASIAMDGKNINNYLEDLYVNIAMDVKKFNYYLGDLYVGTTNLKWHYGNYNRKDVGIACLTSW